MDKLRIIVLISGNGSNLQAIIDAAGKDNLPVEICAVISNRPNAFGLVRAERAHISIQVLAHQDFSTRDDFEYALGQLIDQYRPDLVVLAGFMRKLGATFVKRYQGRMVNIHPSLLPKYPGLHTHRRVLEAADPEHGVTVHYVTEEVDGGPIIGQARLKVSPSDTEETLQERIHGLEHILYPRVLGWFAGKRVKLDNNQVVFDGNLVPRGVNIRN